MNEPVAILVGPPGAGKSSVGRLLAGQLGVAFRDTDDDVEAAAGKAISDIFLDDGEACFRSLERDAVLQALAGHPGVLSLGGGAVLDASVRDRLSGAPVIYLETTAADAAARVGMNAARPLLVGNPRAMLTRLLAERQPLYQQVARATVATAGRSLEQVAADVAGVVRSWS